MKSELPPNYLKVAEFIEESISLRIDTTKRLAKAIEKSEIPPKLFISASAVGQ